MRLLLSAVVLVAIEGVALADADVAPPTPASKVTAEERPFLYLTDPTTPSAGVFTAGYGFGLGSGVPADRPLPAKVGAAGASHTVSLGYGVTSRFAPFGIVTADKDGGATGVFGARFQVTDPGSPFRFTVSGAGFREGRGGALGVWLRGAASYDVGAFRVAGNAHAEKVFASARDSIDVLAMVGASYRLGSTFRLGVEYVGQDLEDFIEKEEAEGGARHFVGPTAALDLGHAQLTAGPAFGLNEKSPRLLGRVAVLVSF
ncbi:MAG: hypothetical protein JNL79_18115 [Myxococcales bacterium]|nr:hypothetical protein [Myxococcales bacterium]